MTTLTPFGTVASHATTVTGSPSTTVLTLASIGSLRIRNIIWVTVAGIPEQTAITDIAGNQIDVSPALSGTPDVPGAVVCYAEDIANSKLNDGLILNAPNAAGLKGLDTTNMATGQKYQISGQLYQLDKSSSATGNDITVIDPTTGPGRWLLIGAVSPLGGSLLLVDPDHPLAADDGRKDTPFDTIGAAYTAAAAGDTVEVVDGTYTETLTWAKRVHLRAKSALNTNATQSGVVIAGTITISTEGLVEFSGISFKNDGASAPAVLYDISGGTTYCFPVFTSCRFSGDAFATAAFQYKKTSGSGYLAVNFHQCDFAHNSGGKAFEVLNADCDVADFYSCRLVGLVDIDQAGASDDFIFHQSTAERFSSLGGNVVMYGGYLGTSSSAVLAGSASNCTVKLYGTLIDCTVGGGEYATKGAGTFALTLYGGVTFGGTASAAQAGITLTIVGGASLADDSVTFAKMQEIGANTIIGNDTGSTANPTAISCTAAGRALLDDASAQVQRATLGFATSLSCIPQPVSGQRVVEVQAISGNTTAYYWMIHVDVEIVVNAISMQTSGTPSTPSTFDIVIFSEDGQTKLINVTSASMSGANTLYTTAVSAVRLVPGVYYAAIVPNTASASCSLEAWDNQGNDTPTGKPVGFGSATVTAGTIPATITPASLTPVSASTNMPWLRLDT